MNKPITILSALLILQLVIAGILTSGDASFKNQVNAKALVSFDASELQEIHLIEDDRELTLVKANDNWQLKSYPELAIVNSKVSTLANVLAKKQVTWPVTNTKSSHKRFNVSQNNFKKQVVFTNKEGEQQTLLLGDSPSFKKVYVRSIEDDDVFSIEFSAYQVTAEANNWLDKSLLSVDGISQISHSVINLEKSDEQWQLAMPSTINEQQVLDTDNIQDFVNQLTGLTVSGLAEQTLEATDKLVIHDDKNKEYTYSFAAHDDSYYVKRDDINQWFTLPKPKFERFTNLSLDTFIKENNPQTEEDNQAVSE